MIVRAERNGEPMNRLKSVKHGEYEILKMLLSGEGTNLAACDGLSDLALSVGVSLDECGDTMPIEDALDTHVQKRWVAAKKNIAEIMLNMLVKREQFLPETHTDAGCDREDLEEMLARKIMKEE